MIYQKLNPIDTPQLLVLMQQYKRVIGESELSEEQSEKLISAITRKEIEFFVAKRDYELIAMCSICTVFSTYLCEKNGILEDFFITEEHRHKGIARGLISFVFEEMRANEVITVWVGCADVDIEMYKSLGFDIPLGKLLTWSSRE